MIPTYLIDKAESKEVEKTPSDMVALCYDLICAETELAEAVVFEGDVAELRLRQAHLSQECIYRFHKSCFL